MSDERVLVTGGAGFIGSHLTRELLRTGMAVVVYDNLSVGKAENVPPGATLITADVSDVDELVKAVAGVDVVFHLAARVSIRASMDGFYEDAQTNILGTLNLLGALRGSRVRKVVLASSMAVYADSPRPDPIPESHVTEPISAYGISKLACEKYLLLFGRKFGINVAALRYFNTYGPGQAYTPYVGVITIFIKHLLSGMPIVVYGDGEQRRDFVSVADVVRASIAAMRWDGQSGIFNVGTGIGTSVNEVASMLIEKVAPRAKLIYEAEHVGEIKNSIADISRARRILGFQPTDALSDALDDLIAAHRKT